VRRRTPLLTVVSWLGGAASLLPFAEDWFDLSGRLGNVALLLAVVSAFVLGVAVRGIPALERFTARLAGPPGRPAHALLVVAVFAPAGAAAMLALTALLGSL
jgi:hypothetical protein